MILLDEPATEPMLEHLIGRIRGAIMKPVILDEGSAVNVGASIGYAVTSEPAEESEEFLDRADRAMYKIKHSRHRARDRQGMRRTVAASASTIRKG